MRRYRPYLFVILFLFAARSRAPLFLEAFEAIVHDPQHKPVADASVTLKSATSDLSQNDANECDGEFTFSTVPVGDYMVTVRSPDLTNMQQTVTVVSDSSPILHFMLEIAP